MENDNDEGSGSPVHSLSQELRSFFPEASHTQKLRIVEDHIQSLLLARRGRDEIFGAELFSDPAWDILLELFAAHLADRRMYLADLARAINAPASTTERWVALLTGRGWVERFEEPGSSRFWVDLTDEGASKIERLADHWASAFVSIGSGDL